MTYPTPMLIDTSNVNEKIYYLIKKRIFDSTYPAGHKINLNNLKEEIGVSQSPIKASLFRLAGEGLVEICSRRGIYVKNVTREDITEIYDTRLIIEAGAGEIVAKYITQEQIAKLENLYKRSLISAANEPYSNFIKEAAEFHIEIIRFANNGRLLAIYENLNVHMQMVRFRYAKRNVKKLPKTDKEHFNILDSLRKHDVKKTKNAIKKHLLNAKKSILQL